MHSLDVLAKKRLWPRSYLDLVTQGFSPDRNLCDQIRQAGGLAAFHQFEQCKGISARVAALPDGGPYVAFKDAGGTRVFPHAAARDRFEHWAVSDGQLLKQFEDAFWDFRLQTK